MALPAFASPFALELKIISVLIEMGGNVAAFSLLPFLPFFSFPENYLDSGRVRLGLTKLRVRIRLAALIAQFPPIFQSLNAFRTDKLIWGKQSWNVVEIQPNTIFN